MSEDKDFFGVDLSHLIVVWGKDTCSIVQIICTNLHSYHQSALNVLNALSANLVYQIL